MKKHVFLFLLIAGIFISEISYSQFTVNAELRPRIELRNGYRLLRSEAKDPAVFVSQRSRISLMYGSDKLNVGFSFQDVRVWGDESLFSSTGVYGDAASLDVNEAWIGLRFLRNSYLKIGRQYFDYDDKRLLFTRNWGQHSVAYDALLYQLGKNNFKLDVAVSYNNNRENIFRDLFTTGKIKTLNFIHLEKKLSVSFKISSILIISGIEKSDTSKTIYIKATYGLYVNYQKDDFNAEYSGYYQNGKNNSGQDVSAFCLHAKAGYAFRNIGFHIGFTLISGDNINTDKDNLFDNLYGARHRYYGFMDYFNNIPKSTQNGGLQDLFGSFNYTLFDVVTFSIDYHMFWNQKKVVSALINDACVVMPKSLGQEIDLYFAVNFLKGVNLRGGYSVLNPTVTLEAIQGISKGGSRFSYWGWLMLTVKPALFSTK